MHTIMPRTYRKKKRTYRKKKTSIMRKLAITKSPMPKVFTTKLRYSESFNLNPASGHIPGVHIFSCNGIYDPNITGAGHQPRGFDQIMPMFDHFRVLGAKIRVSFANTDSAAILMCGIATRDAATAETILYDYTEQGTVRTRLCGTNDASPVSITASVAPYKFLGIPYKNDEMKGSVTANPLEQAYFHVFAASPGSTQDPGIVYVHADIDYLVQFIEPKDLSSS